MLKLQKVELLGFKSFADRTEIAFPGNGVAAVVRGGSQVFKRLETGNVQGYALSILVGVVLILGYFIFNIK